MRGAEFIRFLRRFPGDDRASVEKGRDSMNIKQLEAFVRIVKNKSFSQTAKELFLTQPTVSAYISNLEEELGVRLFLRTTKEVNITEAGEKIYLYAKEIIQLSNQIREVTSGRQEGAMEKEIVISTSSIPGQYLLPSILASYSKSYPNVEFRTNETDSRGVVDDIVSHRAELGFCGTMIQRNGCNYLPFYDDELILVTPNTPKYRKRRELGFQMDWLSEEDFIMRESGSGTRKEAMKILARLGFMPEDVHIKASFASTGAILLSVREQVGVAIVSKLAAKMEIRNGAVLPFRLSENGCFRKIYLLTSTEFSMSEGAKKLVKMMQNHVRRMQMKGRASLSQIGNPEPRIIKDSAPEGKKEGLLSSKKR